MLGGNRVPAHILLTTVILTKNESSKISALLQQADKWSDQLLLLDDFSDDIQQLQGLVTGTKAKIIQHSVNNDFASHRNSIFSEVKGEWTLFLDADELPQPGFWEEVYTSIQEGEHDAYFVTRSNIFLGRKLRFGEAGKKRLLRLAQTTLGKGKWRRAVHEVWQVSASSVGSIRSPLTHRQPESLKAFVAKLNYYAQQEMVVRKSQSRREIFLEVACFPLGKFLWNYCIKQGFRDGFPGFALAFLMSYYSLIVRVQQYEKTL